ncbi:MAG: DUF1570 domain-containing protein [Pirellulaceae bacterium]
MRTCQIAQLLPLLTVATLFVGEVHAQDRSIRVPDPRAFGFNIPPGVISHSIQGNVEARDDEGEKVIAKIHVVVGTHLILMLPDGRLVSRPVSEVQKTDRRFVPIDKKVLESRLAEQFPGFKTRTSRHFVFVYNTTQQFAEVSMRILESMVPGMIGHAKGQKITAHEPDVPLVCIMFSTEREFREFSELPPGVVAYYDTNENYVVMHERPSNPPLKQDLYMRQAISTIAHEGAHQILHNIGVQQRLSRWPMWISEGIAEYYAPTDFGKRMKWKGSGVINDMRMFELELYLKAKDADQADGKMLEDTIGAGQLTSTGYASAWAVTHYLATRKKADFNRFMKKVSETRPLEGALSTNTTGVVVENREQFSEFFGEDFAAIETDIVTHLMRQPYDHPFSEFAHFVAMLQTRSNNRTQGVANVFHSRELALRWQQEQLRRLDADQQQASQAELKMFANRVLAVQYASQWLRTNN